MLKFNLLLHDSQALPPNDTAAGSGLPLLFPFITPLLLFNAAGLGLLLWNKNNKSLMLLFKFTLHSITMYDYKGYDPPAYATGESQLFTTSIADKGEK